MLTIDAERLARELMDQHGLNDWSFGFDRAMRRFGCCHVDRRRITMSRAFTELNDEAQVRDTILHEIAHALCPIYEGHGPEWKAKAKAIGCSHDRGNDGEHVKMPPLRYTATCHVCGGVHHRNQAVESSCSECSGGIYNPEFRLVWTRTDGKPIKPKVLYIGTCPECGQEVGPWPYTFVGYGVCWVCRGDDEDEPKFVWRKAELSRPAAEQAEAVA